MLQIYWLQNKSGSSMYAIQGLLWFGLCLLTQLIFCFLLCSNSASILDPWAPLAASGCHAFAFITPASKAFRPLCHLSGESLLTL